MLLPPEAAPLLALFAAEFTSPTAARVHVLTAAILTTGRTLHGKARHRDPVRSSHAFTAWRHGREWVVLAAPVKFPFATRPRALPVLIDWRRRGDGDAGRPVPVRAGHGGGPDLRRDPGRPTDESDCVAGLGDRDLYRRLACVRRRTWSEGVLRQAGCGPGLAELPEPVRELLLTTLAPAA